MSHTARLAVVSLTLLSAAATADQPKPGDEVLYQTLKDVINRGADLYNAGEPAACYYLYKGSLLTLKPELAGRPELEKVVAKALSSAEKDPVMWRRAFTLRDALDRVRSEINPNKKDRDKSKASEGDKGRPKASEGDKDTANDKPKTGEDKKETEKLKAPQREGERKEGDKKDAIKKDGEKKGPDKDAG